MELNLNNENLKPVITHDNIKSQLMTFFEGVKPKKLEKRGEIDRGSFKIKTTNHIAKGPFRHITNVVIDNDGNIIATREIADTISNRLNVLTRLVLRKQLSPEEYVRVEFIRQLEPDKNTAGEKNFTQSIIADYKSNKNMPIEKYDENQQRSIAALLNIKI